MNIDSFYTNGKLHGHQGQDYALHGEDYFIICDGCSSSKHSDIAARLQSHIAKKYLYDFHLTEYDMNHFNLMTIGLELKQQFKLLSIDSLPLATLVIGLITKDLLRVVVVGDGVIVYKNKNEEQKIIEISYSNNAPFYPYYYTNNNLLEEYKNNFESKDISKVTKIFDNEEVNIDFDFIDFNKPSIYDFQIKDLEYLYIFSDGISELTGKTKLPITETVETFTSMKNINKSFIQRRCKRQLKMYEKDGIFPQDDFSMAGVYLNEKT